MIPRYCLDIIHILSKGYILTKCILYIMNYPAILCVNPLVVVPLAAFPLASMATIPIVSWSGSFSSFFSLYICVVLSSDFCTGISLSLKTGVYGPQLVVGSGETFWK